ncbi:MAG: FtsH protease activity modulator HflK [Planctomycetota bacterium]
MSARRRGKLRPMRWVALALCAGALWSSIWTVGRDERGVVTRFAAVQREVGSGVHLTLPWPLESMTRVATTQVRTVTIGAAAGSFGSSQEEAEWLTGDTNIIEMRIAVQFVVDDPAAYLYSVADFRDGRAREAALDLAVRAELTRLVARTRVDEALSTGKAELQREARIGVQKLIDDLRLGVRVLAINIAEARPPLAVISAFNDVASAESDRERLITEADGYRRDLLPTARSKANQLVQDALVDRDEAVNRARGAAARFGAVAAEVRGQPKLARQRLWLDAVRRVLGRGKTIVYPVDPDHEFVLRAAK